MRGLVLIVLGILVGLNHAFNVLVADNETLAPNWDENPVVLNEVPPRPRPPLPSFIRVTSWEDRPYSWLDNSTGTLRGKGLAFELFDLIMPTLNMTYEIVKPEPEVVGNGRIGMMKLLKEKKVDVAVAFIPIIAELRSFCAFSVILDEIDITVLLKRPRESAVGSGLLAPFDTTVWICILISLIIIGPIIFVVTTFRSWIFDRTKEDTYTYGTCVWFAYGAILKQGSPITPVNDSIRLLFATWWLFITILTSFYTANLTAFLTLSEFTLDIKSLTDVVHKRQTWVAETDHIINLNLQQRAETELDELRASYFNNHGKFIPIGLDKHKDILRQVNMDQLYIGNKELNDEIIYSDYLNRTKLNIPENKRCVYVMMPQEIFKQYRGFAYQHNSTIQEEIDRKLRYMVEMGILKHLETVHMPEVRYCPLDLKSTERQLTNTDLSLTYQVVGSGYVFSILMFFIEMIQRCLNCESCLCCSDSCSCCASRISNTPLETVKSISPPQPSFRVEKIPPIYESIYNRPALAKTHIINGRDYWIITEHDGERRLVPIRSPSALLFQYTS